jgi:hypothetical protein
MLQSKVAGRSYIVEGEKKGWRSLVKEDGRGGSFVEEGGRQELYCRGRRKLWMSLVDRGGRLFLEGWWWHSMSSFVDRKIGGSSFMRKIEKHGVLW